MKFPEDIPLQPQNEENLIIYNKLSDELMNRLNYADLQVVVNRAFPFESENILMSNQTLAMQIQEVLRYTISRKKLGRFLNAVIKINQVAISEETTEFLIAISNNQDITNKISNNQEKQDNKTQTEQTKVLENKSKSNKNFWPQIKVVTIGIFSLCAILYAYSYINFLTNETESAQYEALRHTIEKTINNYEKIKLYQGFLRKFPNSGYKDAIAIEISLLEDETKQNIKYKVLLIANQDYEHDTIWPDLQSPKNDVEKLAKILREQYGITDIEIVIDANEQGIENAFINLKNAVKKDDSVLIYYAGHGSIKGDKAYWIPVDGKDNTTSFVDSIIIKDHLIKISARCLHLLLISDSCFSDSLFRSGEMEVIEEPRTYFSNYYPYQSSQVISSSFAEANDTYIGIPNSPFAVQLFTILDNTSKTKISASELGLGLKRILPTVTNGQKPSFGELKGTVNQGEFFFVKPN